ncbi:MAG: glycosyltransferase family 4 protein [Pyrinomonadaceae bacterium]
MRIAFLTTEYVSENYFAGGIANYLSRAASALRREGHEPEIFTLSHEQERIRHEEVMVHRVTPGTLKTKVSATRYIWRYEGYAEAFGDAWRLAAALRRRHEEIPFDIVQAANYRACGLLATLRKPAPVVTRISSYEPLWREAYKRPATAGQLQFERAEMIQMRRSSALYAPSKLLAETLRQKEGLAVHVIEPPFRFDGQLAGDSLPQSLAPETYALFFGNIGYAKGCDRLLKVLPALLERNAGMKFVFVGDADKTEEGQPFDQHLRESLARYADRVEVLPAQRHAQLLPIIRHARFVALPSKIDNLPNTCLEAMALKRIVIGTQGASFDQLIRHGASGFLVSQSDDDDLAARMEQVWRMDAQERERIGAEAALSLERLKPEHAIKRLVAFYEEVISGTKH